MRQSLPSLQLRPKGLEPPTPGSEDRCSIQLSYGRKNRRKVGGVTGLEPAPSGSTTQRANQLRHTPHSDKAIYAREDSNLRPTA